MSLLRHLGFGGSPSPSSADTQTVRRIVASLDAMDPARARFIAAFAFLLCRVARTDLVISDDEAREMERIVMERGGLAEEQAVLVLEVGPGEHRAGLGTPGEEPLVELGEEVLQRGDALEAGARRGHLLGSRVRRWGRHRTRPSWVPEKMPPPGAGAQ